MFRDHVDQEKERHLKQIIIETGTKVERIVRLVKSVNSGNKEAKLKKRSEAVRLIEDFYKRYQSMCAMYEDLREDVKKKCNNKDNESSTSSCSSSNLPSMESSAYHSPGSGSKTPSIDQPRSSLDSFNIQNQEAETEIEKKTKEAADFLERLECLTEKLQQKARNEACLVEERNSLENRVQDLELTIVSINDTNKKQRETISQLDEKLQEKEVQISVLESDIECVKKDLSNKIKSLKSLEIDKSEVEGKNVVLAARLEQKDELMCKLNHEAECSFKASVKKMGEMVDEFRFKTEDSIRILSRRIRVAEQLHNETREWYKKTINKHEQNRRDNELAFHSIKIITSMVSETLNVSETFGLRFVERCEDVTNRVSKVSCETKFVKDWVKRKNGVIVQVKDDFDRLVVQLDDKEEEILGSRQKVLRLETRLREIEKIVKENDETLIVLKEEKREAIRQLCVWIDYHRNRYDSLKKAFSEFVARYQKPG